VPLAPGVHDEEDKDEKTQDEEDNGPWLLFPQNLETFRDLLEIHASSIYTPVARI
jgi:hypothetical protein